MNQNKSDRTPVLDPLLLLLKSRRVVVALVSLLVSLLILAFPELDTIQHELLTLILSLAMMLIGGYSLEDAASAARSTPPPEAWQEELRELVNVVLDEVLDQGSQQGT